MTAPVLPWRSRVITAPLTAPKLDDDLTFLFGLSYSAPVAVADLPAGAAAGLRAFVSDSTATTFNSVVAGGGGDIVPVWSDGAVWRIG